MSFKAARRARCECRGAWPRAAAPRQHVDQPRAEAAAFALGAHPVVLDGQAQRLSARQAEVDAHLARRANGIGVLAGVEHAFRGDQPDRGGHARGHRRGVRGHGQAPAADHVAAAALDLPDERLKVTADLHHRPRRGLGPGQLAVHPGDGADPAQHPVERKGALRVGDVAALGGDHRHQQLEVVGDAVVAFAGHLHLLRGFLAPFLAMGRRRALGHRHPAFLLDGWGNAPLSPPSPRRAIIRRFVRLAALSTDRPKTCV